MATADQVVVEIKANARQAQAELRRYSADFDRSMGRSTRAIEAHEAQIRASSQRISASLKAMAGALAAGVSANAVRGMADSYTRLSNSIIASGVAAEDRAAVEDRLYAAGLRNGAQVEALAQLYRRAAMSGDALGATTETLLDLTDGVAAALRVEGLAAQDARGPLLQLGQALASPIVRAEELNSVMEGVPEIARAAARGFGASVADMRTAVLDGEVTNRQFFEALTRGLGETERLASTLPLTLDAAGTVFVDALGRYVGHADDSLEATERLVAGVTGLADNLHLVAGALATVSVIAGGRFAQGLAMGALAQDGIVGKSRAAVEQIQSEAAERLKLARAAALQARADVDAAASRAAAARRRIAALREEIAAYQANMAAAQAQITAARQAREASEAARRLGLGVAVGAGDLSSVKAGQQQQEQATRALIQNRRALAAAETQLAAATRASSVAQNEATAAMGRASAAATVYGAAVQRASILAVAGAVAARGLGAALSFFGGPIGVAIIAVATAIGVFTSSALKARQAADDLRASLEQDAALAARAGVAISDFAGKTDDAARSAREAANAASDQADAYSRLRTNALNAGRAIAYMTAAQRQQRIEETEEQLQGLGNRIRGQTGAGRLGGTAGWVRDRVGTDLEEDVRNAFRDAAGALGLRGSGRFGANAQAVVAEAERNLENLTDAQRDAVQNYQQRRQVLRETLELERQGREYLRQLNEARGTPTIPLPPEEEWEPVELGGGGGGGGSGGRGGSSSGNADQIARARAELDIEREIALARASGDEAAIRAAEERQELARLTGQYEAAGYADARAAAIEHLGWINQAIQGAEERERIEQQIDDLIAASERRAERRVEAERLQTDLTLDRLGYEAELARLSGNEGAIAAAERRLWIETRILEIMRLRKGLTEDEARAMAGAEWDELDRTEAGRDMARSVVDVLRADNIWGEAGRRFRDAAWDGIENLLSQLFSNMGSGKDGGILGAIFGGFRASGGPVSAGRAYVVGEKRPELFVPNTSGTIIPSVNAAMAGMGARAGGSPTYIVNVNASDAVLTETVRGWVREGMQQAVGQAVQTSTSIARRSAPGMQQQQRRLGTT